MKYFTKLYLLLFCLLVYSCGGSGDVWKPKIKTNENYNATNEQVWNAVIAALGDMNYPIKTIEKASWLIQSDRVTISSDDIEYYCAVEGGRYKSGRLSFTFYLSSQDSNNTTMKIASDFEGTYTSGYGTYSSTDVIQLYSNGKYEKELFDLVKSKIK